MELGTLVERVMGLGKTKRGERGRWLRSPRWGAGTSCCGGYPTGSGGRFELELAFLYFQFVQFCC